MFRGKSVPSLTKFLKPVIKNKRDPSGRLLVLSCRLMLYSLSKKIVKPVIKNVRDPSGKSGALYPGPLLFNALRLVRDTMCTLFWQNLLSL